MWLEGLLSTVANTEAFKILYLTYIIMVSLHSLESNSWNSKTKQVKRKISNWLVWGLVNNPYAYDVTNTGCYAVHFLNSCYQGCTFCNCDTTITTVHSYTV